MAGARLQANEQANKWVKINRSQINKSLWVVKKKKRFISIKYVNKNKNLWLGSDCRGRKYCITVFCPRASVLGSL